MCKHLLLMCGRGEGKEDQVYDNSKCPCTCSLILTNMPPTANCWISWDENFHTVFGTKSNALFLSWMWKPERHFFWHGSFCSLAFKQSVCKLVMRFNYFEETFSHMEATHGNISAPSDYVVGSRPKHIINFGGMLMAAYDTWVEQLLGGCCTFIMPMVCLN